MATVTGFTADRMQQIEDNVITAADIVDGDLILIRYDGSQLNAGPIAGSILNPSGVWDAGTAYAKSDMVFHDAATWLATGATVAGEEPGVDAVWQKFAVSGYSDVTNGDHNIQGTLTFVNHSPIIPAAEDDTRAANLGDVKTEIAQEPLLLDSARDEITYVEESGDIRTVLTQGLVRQHHMTSSGIYFPIANTTAEVAICTSPFLAGTFTNQTRLRFSYSGRIKNNTGIDIDFTLRLKCDSTTYPDQTVSEFVFTIPTNSPATNDTRPFFLSGEAAAGNLFSADNKILYGTTRLIVGDIHGTDGDIFIERIKSTDYSGNALLTSKATDVVLTAQINVAHADAALILSYASVEVLPYVAP